MKGVLIIMLYQIVKQMVDARLFDRIQGLVLGLMDKSLPGDMKKQMVREAIWKEWTTVSAIVIDTVVQTVLLKFLPKDKLGM